MDVILKMLNNQYSRYPSVKVAVDRDDNWSDMLSFYKCASGLSSKRLRVCRHNEPAVDTGGVCRETYTTVFTEFIHNDHIHLFDGPTNHLRPHYSAEARGSGIFTALGTMVAHAIFQDGIGFPYLSPLCYWYIARGETEALQYASLDDIGEDSVSLVSKVH